MTENERAKVWNEVIDTIIQKTHEHNSEYITSDSSTCLVLVEIFEQLKRVVLEPCPCCGGEARIYTQDPYKGSGERYGIICVKCALQTKDYDNKTTAIAIWNRRSVEK